MVRPAVTADAAAVAGIFNQGIRERGATFETVEHTANEVRDWLTEPLAAAHPFLVADDADRAVIGWVRASSYRGRACYSSIVEFSVYVAGSARGRRVGDALMSAFIPACAASGVHKIVSRIFPENEVSRALCARHGFREVGVYEKHAQLDGVWRDVVIVERLISENLA
ncbi:MAG TPA: arsinothricin resistance N-acetyltransferase ArsN1 family A [Gemmatimonadales bacterium]|nr:arsinothricin resistance N-acetyltransferase ArsN1 family A [Gemmatimonadales bacterium]